MPKEAEERRGEAEAEASGDPVYSTKVVQFLGRTTPIVLQDENGPCPLLAVGDVLLLRKFINRSVDEPEVAQHMLAERLIDSNGNLQGKDDAYVNNQQQNMADAIDLLPRLATGIDVNVLFRKIDGFEFTEILDVALYHGRMVDPQDVEIASVIDTKSYNTLVADYVSRGSEKDIPNLEMSDQNVNQDEGSQIIDFVTACTSALGVLVLSRRLSLQDIPVPPIVSPTGEQGDVEEDEELKPILNPSISEIAHRIDSHVTSISRLSSENTSLDVNQCIEGSSGEQSTGKTGRQHDAVGSPDSSLSVTNSDMKVAIALQQQEFEQLQTPQQRQQQPQQLPYHQRLPGRDSKLVVGPQIGLFVGPVLLLTGCLAEGATYEVGGTAGWTLLSPLDRTRLTRWAANHTFVVGDSLHFVYHPPDTVVLVSQHDFSTCSSTSPRDLFFQGDSYYRCIEPGVYYFISGIQSHCLQGQRISIIVHVSWVESPPPSVGVIVPPPSVSVVSDMRPSWTIADRHIIVLLFILGGFSVACLLFVILFLVRCRGRERRWERVCELV